MDIHYIKNSGFNSPMQQNHVVLLKNPSEAPNPAINASYLPDHWKSLNLSWTTET